MTKSRTAAESGSLAYTTLLPIIAMVAASFLAVGIVLYFAGRNSDAGAREREAALMANAVSRSITEIAWRQERLTDQSGILNALAAGDLDWIDGHAGIRMHDYFSIDRVYILDTSGRPIYAMENGKRVPSDAYGADETTLGPIARRLQTAVAASSGEIAVVDGRAAFVWASMIRAETPTATDAAPSGYVHFAIRFVDGRYLDGLSSRTLVDNPRFAWHPPEGAAFHALKARDGAPVGGIAWTAKQPGLGLIRDTLPILMVTAALLTAVVGWLGRRLYRASADLESSEAEANRVAYVDPLTGLPNRAALCRDLADRIEALADGHRVAVVTIDIERFRNITDSFGHLTGDALVAAFAGRLCALVRGDDLVARLGRDEFGIIQSDPLDPEDVAALCRRVLADAEAPFEVKGHLIHIGISIGAAIAPDDGSGSGDLMRKADIARHRAKGASSGYRLFEPSMELVTRRRQAIEQDLRRALGRPSELTVAFQPIVGRDGIVPIGMEALARWNHQDGFLEPNVFIPVAEETGLIVPLGELVLRHSLRAASSLGRLGVSINVSPIQIERPDFLQDFVTMLEEEGVDPNRVELEITETALLDGRTRSTQSLTQLKQLGVRIALDDFGTGYSSLGYLRSFPVDRIKIDRSFVRSLTGEPATREIVRSIVTLGHALGMSVTAEGIETEAQLDILRETGCDAFQGFLFSPPVPATVMAGFAAGDPLPVGRRRVRLAAGAA